MCRQQFVANISLIISKNYLFTLGHIIGITNPSRNRDREQKFMSYYPEHRCLPFLQQALRLLTLFSLRCKNFFTDKSPCPGSWFEWLLKWKIFVFGAKTFILVFNIDIHFHLT